ncbi:MAG: dihydropteroate synthase [Actinomycetota bacterium]|nr:dihydropteroate synthase [Actinomycetota bacterium]
MGSTTWRMGDRAVDCSERTLVMGVVNVTPDSFSDGGRFVDHDVAVAAAVRMAEEGADIVDVGGESTRPGAAPVPAAEQVERVAPVIKAVAAEVDVPVSVDTRSVEVAAAAVNAGAVAVNDVSAGADPDMFAVVRETGAGLVLMHMRGDPTTMQDLARYDDVVGEVRDELRARLDAALDAGLDLDRLCVDPGIGFAKTWEHSLVLMRHLDAFLELGRPLVVGPSRKSFIGQVLGLPVEDRLEGTLAAVAYAATRGAHVVRVHDVREAVRVLRVIDAIRGT